MKSKYQWYLRRSDDELKALWETATLTVDANVLLDLYRYNEATRNALLESLNLFKGRTWLSHQVSEEFIRNRAKVIVSVDKSFKEADGEVKKLIASLDSAVSQLKGNRIVARAVTENLQSQVKGAVATAEEAISAASQGHPDFLYEDPILESLLELFDGAVGEDFLPEDRDAATTEAQRRIDDKIPPGYMDDDKEGDRKFGDYFLWRQVLNRAKEKRSPMILVTSERKEDWWEKHSGKTVGPRMELLREAAKETEQAVLIYKTEQFLELVAKSKGTEADEEAVEDIQAIGKSRHGSGLAVEILQQIVEESDERTNIGQLVVRLNRPLFSFTCSGALHPHMESAPHVYIRLVESPNNMPMYKLGAGAGTDFDFNAHIKSKDYGVALPVGTYGFSYEAKVEDNAEGQGHDESGEPDGQEI